MMASEDHAPNKLCELCCLESTARVSHDPQSQRMRNKHRKQSRKYKRNRWMRAKCNDLSVLSKTYANCSVNERQHGASNIPKYSSRSSDQRLVQSNLQEFTENSFVGAVNDMRHRDKECLLCCQRHAQMPH